MIEQGLSNLLVFCFLLWGIQWAAYQFLPTSLAKGVERGVGGIIGSMVYGIVGTCWLLLKTLVVLILLPITGPRYWRRLQRGWGVAFNTSFICEYCGEELPTTIQLSCPVCRRTAVRNLMEQCRCGAPESRLEFFDCPHCDNSIDLR